MRLTADELDRRFREILERLTGPHMSLAVTRDLVDLGFSPKVAWAIVESSVRPRRSRNHE